MSETGLVDDEPSISSHENACRVELNQSTVLRILYKQLLCPFHLQHVQCLNPEVYPQRRQLCEWFLHQSAVVPDFANCVLFSDESAFTRNGIFNTHN